ncbi:Uncharacterized protein APZ42_004511, partial [Daphnia magna]
KHLQLERTRPKGKYSQTNNMRNQGNSRIYLPQKSRPDSVFTRIEPNTKFFR